MAGNPDNASIWADADVYVGDTDATDPADIDTAFGATWDLVGLLNGDAGFTDAIEEDVQDHYGWGVHVRTSRRNFKLTRGFTVIEDNDVTRELLWPGSTAAKLYQPRPQRIKIAFETRDGAKKLRYISAFEAEVGWDGDINWSEAELTAFPLIATIYPDVSDTNALGGALLWNRQVSA
ncbi:MAG: hypothetical protein ACK5O2_00595 [Microthrixaceae bacterium]